MCLSCRKKSRNDNDILFWHDLAFCILLREVSLSGQHDGSQVLLCVFIIISVMGFCKRVMRLTYFVV